MKPLSGRSSSGTERCYWWAHARAGARQEARKAAVTRAVLIADARPSVRAGKKKPTIVRTFGSAHNLIEPRGVWTTLFLTIVRTFGSARNQIEPQGCGVKQRRHQRRQQTAVGYLYQSTETFLSAHTHAHRHRLP